MADITEDDDASNAEPMLIIAFLSEVPSGSLTLTYEKEDDTATVVDYLGPDSRTGAEPPRLNMEIDSAYPVRLVTNPDSPNDVSASCRYRIYPASSGAAPSVTSGSTRPKETSLSMQVVETLVFSGSATINLRYKPAGSISTEVIGVFLDQWGDTFTPTILKPGDTMTTVNWINENTYSSPKDKKLTEYEIGIASFMRKAMPSKGIMKVSYATTYDLHEFHFKRARDTGDTIRFEDSFVFAVYNGSVAGQLQLSGPSLRGKK